MSQMTIAQAINLALGHHQAGRLQDAESIYRQILAHDPKNADALHLLGVVAHQCGNYPAAIELIGKSISIQPVHPSAYTNLGESLRLSGRLPEARDALLKAIQQQPTSAEALGNLGLVYAGMGQGDQALDAYRQALAINPNLPQTHNNLGNLLLEQKDAVAALAAYDRALAIDPNFSDGHNNRGSALENMDRLEEAIAEYKRAVELRPNFAIACNNVGNVARRLCQWDEAILWCKRALQLDPSFEPARWNVGLIELTRGDYASGLPKYELRFVATPQRLPEGITRPRWDGSPLEGKTLLLYAEQGIGDGWQAARYVPMIARKGGKVIIACMNSQAGLLANLEGVIATTPSGKASPPYDLFLPMMSLPLIFGTTLQTIPLDVPYLKPDPARVAAWAQKMSTYSGLKVGLVWSGSANPEPLRSMTLAELAPLAEIPSVQYFSLQFGPAAAEAKKAVAWMNIVDLSDDVADFGETAACMMNLDLILTIDTAAAHLAGALARPTWTMLPFSPDWRWLLDRPDSVWYPTMKLFRQTRRKVWTDVVEHVAIALRELTKSQRAGSDGS
jgi:tetratricopeptide (TPR) repeat protein